jgi:hypothetical protein
MENDEPTNFPISTIQKEEKELKGFIEGNVKVVKNGKNETFILLEEIFQGTVSAKEALKNSIILELSGKWSSAIQKIINPNVNHFEKFNSKNLLTITRPTIKKNETDTNNHPFKLKTNKNTVISIQTNKVKAQLDEKSVNSDGPVIWRELGLKRKKNFTESPSKIQNIEYTYTNLKDIRVGIHHVFGFVVNYSTPRNHIERSIFQKSIYSQCTMFR